MSKCQNYFYNNSNYLNIKSIKSNMNCHIFMFYLYYNNYSYNHII